MRRCQAAVMVVTADEQSKVDGDPAINTNVLIEIGSAFVLYDEKVVLLWTGVSRSHRISRAFIAASSKETSCPLR